MCWQCVETAHGASMLNPVHALMQQLAGSFPAGAACYVVDDQPSWYRAMTIARQAIGWTIAQAEEKIGLAERHLSKIEPAREKNWSAKAYLRLPFRLQLTNTAKWMMQAYGLRLMLIPAPIADALLNAAPPGPVRLTVAQRRRAGILGDQLELPLPSPARKHVSVSQVEEAVRDRKVRKRLLEAA